MLPHPNARPASPLTVAAWVDRDDQALILRYSLCAVEDAVRIPPSARVRGRAAGLWQTTCFELFIRGEGQCYAELNLSPSGQWAAYAFDSYREGMRELDSVGDPRIQTACQLGQLGLTARLRLPPGFMRPGSPIAVSAVVEEREGRKSYWALAHATGVPDFHHPDCFVAKLP